MINYTLIIIVAILVIAIVAIAALAMLGMFTYRFELLKIKGKTKIDTNLQTGNVNLETSCDIDGIERKKQ